MIKHVTCVQQNHKNTNNNKLEAHLSLYHSPDYKCNVCVLSMFKVFEKNLFIIIPICKQC